MSIAQVALDSGIYLVELNWPLNAHWADKTTQMLKEAADHGGKRIIVNLENVPFIDSHGLAALVNGLRFFNDDAKNLCLAAPQRQARLFFRLTKFDRVFRIYDSVAEVSL